MGPIPYYFLWSPNYEIFANILKVGIGQYPSIFQDCSIFIPQEQYDTTLHENVGHFLCGSYLKLEKTYELLCTLPEDSYFIFSDADILIFPGKPLEKLIQTYIDIQADLVFMREATKLDFYNVGFSLIRVNEKNRQLFKQTLEEAYKHPLGLDGSLLNDAMKTYTGSIFYFPHEFVMTSSTLIDVQQKQNVSTMMQHLYVFQALCDPTRPKEERMFAKLMQYKSLGVPIEFRT